jgi:hypothetical protein
MNDRIRTQRGPRAKGDHRTHETSDISARAAALTIGGLAATVVVVCVGVAALLLLFGGLSEPAPPPPSSPVAPTLQVNERADRRTIEARSELRLDGRRGGASIDAAMRGTAAAGWDDAR